MPELPKRLQEHLRQPGAFITDADREFIEAVRALAARGVGYGFMQQVAEWMWEEKCPGGSWGPEYFEAKVLDLERRLASAYERCAKIADDHAPATPQRDTATLIALAIRSAGATANEEGKT